MQPLYWSELQVFMAIAHSGQLTRAAQRLQVDATTIGRALRRLENRLGTRLFEQTREGQLLTEAGESLLASVEEMARAASEIVEGGTAEGGPVGTLRVSVSEGFGSWFVAKHVQAFLAEYPSLKLDLVANSGFLNPSKREADIAVLLSRPRSGPLVARKLTDYALRLYGEKGYLNERGKPATIDMLATGYRLIGYIPDLLYAPELNYFNEINPGLSPDLRSSSINAQHRLIASGNGIGVLPRFMGDADDSLSAILPQHQIVRTFWLVTHQDTQNLSRVRAGKDWLVEMAAEHRDILLPER